MSRLFGTSGIRGVTNQQITTELALQVSHAFGSWLFRTWRRRGRVCVAHDTRFGAPALASAAAAGLASAGHDVIQYSVLPIGAFAANLRALKADGGIMITGSHMPYDRIGIQLILADGTHAPFEITDDIERILRDRDFLRVRADDMGRISQGADPIRVYAADLLQHVDRRAIAARHYKVLIDPGNGAASVAAREVLERLGCEVFNINSTPQEIPNRPSEPRAANVEHARATCKVLKLDLGFCFDTDADRVLFLNSRGEPLSEDAVGAVFAHHELQAGDCCVAPVSSSSLIEWMCRRIGARVAYCRIGQPEIVRTLREEGGAFAYEETGKYFFARRFLWSDGIFSAVRFLDILAKERRSAAELVQELPKLVRLQHDEAVSEARQEAVVRRASERLAARPAPEGTRDVTVDGFKRIFPDLAWIMFRRSRTEPLVRLSCEAASSARAHELLDEGKAILKAALQE